MIPPLLGFFAKLFVLLSAISSGYYFMSIIAIITSVLSTTYYIKIIRFLHSDSSISNNKPQNYKDYVISNYPSFYISILTLSILLFFIKPSLLLNSTNVLSLVFFNL